MKKQDPKKIIKLNRQSKIFLSLGIIIIVIGVFLQLLKSNSKADPQPVDIFVVDSSMQYGYITLQGIIRSDVSSSGEGNYYLVLSDDRLVGIDKTRESELKRLVGKKVEITGELLEIPDLGVVGLMLPSNITQK